MSFPLEKWKIIVIENNPKIYKNSDVIIIDHFFGVEFFSFFFDVTLITK